MKCSFMSRTFLSEQKKAKTNSEPWSEVTCEGTPCLEKTWRMNNLANIGDVMVLMVKIKIDCLVSVWDLVLLQKHYKSIKPQKTLVC